MTTDIKRHKKIRNDLSGKSFGKLTCVKPTGEFRHSTREWLCLCECGDEHITTANHLVSGNIKSCGCISKQINSNHRNWKGYGEISGRYFSQLQRGAKSRGLEFKVSIQYIWDVFLKQERICKLSGVLLKFGSTAKGKSLEQTASLDRINPSKGYIRGNVQWIHQDVNFIKQDLTEEKLLDWCQKIINNAKER
jgi:hypothetical protein